MSRTFDPFAPTTGGISPWRRVAAVAALACAVAVGAPGHALAAEPGPANRPAEPDDGLAQLQAALLADPRYQAAQDATERVRVLVTRDEEARDKLTDRLIRDLDPRRPDFGAQVDRIFASLGQDPRATTKRVVLLHWLVEHDHRPQAHGFSRAVTELMALGGQLLADPDALDLIPGVCEYVMTWYPRQPGVGQGCRAVVAAVDNLRGLDRAALRQSWRLSLANANNDWVIGIRDNAARIHDLFTLCGRKARLDQPRPQRPAQPRGD